MVFHFRFRPPTENMELPQKTNSFSAAGEIENERPYLKFQRQRPLSLKLKVWSFVFDFARRWKRIRFLRKFHIFRWRAKSKMKNHTLSFKDKGLCPWNLRYGLSFSISPAIGKYITSPEIGFFFSGGRNRKRKTIP